MPEVPAPASPEHIRFRCDLSPQGIGNSDDLSPSIETVGQPEALEALRLGITLRAPGYNIYLAGVRGTGRFAAVRELIEKLRPTCPVARSFSYVHNLEDPYRPILVILPRGRGKEFQNALEELRDVLDAEIPTLLESEVINRGRQRLAAKYERESQRLLQDFETRVDEAGLQMVMVSSDNTNLRTADLMVQVGDEVLPIEQIRSDPEETGFSAEQAQELEENRKVLMKELNERMREQRKLGQRYQELIKGIERKRVEEAIAPLFEDIANEFGAQSEAVGPYLESIQSEILDHLELFREREMEARGEGPAAPPGQPPRVEGLLAIVRSNLLHEPSGETDASACHIIEEAYPSYRNLFGGIEAGGDPTMTTFLDIRGGDILKADGGFLVLSARDVVTDPRVYETLKRTLLKGELEITPKEDGPGQQVSLKPSPIPISVKVVLIGQAEGYDILSSTDPDFRKIFKIKAHFDDSMPRNEQTTRSYLAVVKRLIERESMPTFERGALEALVEEGTRIAGSRHRLTTHFGQLADLMREAGYVSGLAGHASVTREDQVEAIRMHERRHGLIERKMMEGIQEEKVLVDVTGTEVGMVNGLGYYDLGDYQFGMPARVSASTATGAKGVVNIEREAYLSGSIHDKGVLIIGGFLASRFARDKPLSLTATVAFEQSYVTVDGDSATLAELLAILSSLTAIPLRQGLAVTGSMNQRGVIQPVGGVTEKVTGFYRTCELRGMTGRQGVVLPARNLDDLQLSTEISEAVAEGRFHIHPVTYYTQALELFTRRPATQVMEAAEAQLLRFAEIVRDYR